MIRIWNRTSIWPDKVNFIDTNNVILGYDLGQSCCEHAFWTISEKQDGSDPIHKGDNEAPQELTLEGYVFDPSFCEQSDDNSDEYVATFKLKNIQWGESKPDLYLRLENHHNGYYGHGFIFRGASTIEDIL